MPWSEAIRSWDAEEMKRDVFIIHTQGDSYEAKLKNAITQQLCRWGLSAWAYEDWVWEREGESCGRWSGSGEIDQVDFGELSRGNPEPFYSPPRGPEPDREKLEFMFAQSGAIAFITPRSGEPSPGMGVELDVLCDPLNPPFPPFFRILWPPKGQYWPLIDYGVPSFFDYRMPSLFPKDLSVPAETCARLAWLACMMRQLERCGAMGRDVHRQLARRDALLNDIACKGSQLKIALEPDPIGNAVLATDATADECLPVLEHWQGGPVLTVRRLATGKPPSNVVAASMLVERLLGNWCHQAREQFPELDAPSAKTSLALGATKLRLDETSAAIADFDTALGAPDSEQLRPFILLLRGFARSELGQDQPAIRDFAAISKIVVAIFTHAQCHLKAGELNRGYAGYTRGRFIIEVIGAAKTRTMDRRDSIERLERVFSQFTKEVVQAQMRNEG